MRKIFDFHGGIHPQENKTQTTQTAIATIPLAKELVLPLSQHIGAPAAAIVDVGQTVLKGELVAEAQGMLSANIHAPTSGTISAIEDRPISHSSGMSAMCVVIETDGEDKWIECKENSEPESLAREDIIDIVSRSGIAGMGGAGFPTQVKLHGLDIETLILNAAECEPYITADDMLIREFSEDILRGALLLANSVLHAKHIVVGIEDNKPEAIAALNKVIAQNNWLNSIEVAVVPTKYPSGGEKQLIKLLTGKEVPGGGIPAHIGIVMQNVGTVLAAWRAVRFGEPLISRVTTVAGKALSTQQNIEVPLGTPVTHILEHHGFKQSDCERVVIGGPMMGYTIHDTQAPIVKTTNCILAPSKDELPSPPPAQACIRCGMCAEACPADLLPQQLYWYARAEEADKLKAYNLFDCIECGACSFVCPSSIPLVQYYRAAKGTIRQAQQEKEKSDRARERFEARQERIEKEEAEKLAKREARKKAAEEAREKIAHNKEGEHKAEKKKPSPGLVEQAIAEAGSKAVDPDKESAKLRRALSSAESRLQRAQEALQKNEKEGAEAERLDALRARIKQAEQKVAEAQKKLDDVIA